MTPSVTTVDRSLLRLRVLVSCALALLALWLAREGSNRAAAAMLAGAALAPSIAAVEGLLRRALGLVPASFVAVFADVAVVLGLLWGTGQRPDSMAVFAFALPLIEAGVRHGIRGVVATWLAVAFLVAGWTALEWDDLSLTARDPLTVTGLLLLTAVPAAHMADHLVERVEQYAHAHAGAEHRSALLTSVLRSAAGLIVPEVADVEANLVRATADLTGSAAVAVVDGASADAPITVAARHHDGAAVQIEDGSGTSIGVWLGPRWGACLVARLPARPDPETVEALEVLGAHARISYAAAAQHAQARRDAERWARQARTDPLTGLLNRAGLVELLDRWLRDPAHGPAIVLFIDVDGLKQINDVYGHEEGDTLIRTVADRLRAAFPTAPAARLGGDEFVLVLPAAAAADLGSTVTAVRERIEAPHPDASRVSISVGAAVGSPGLDVDAASLIKRADEAMYLDKRQRRAARQPAGTNAP